MKRLFVTSTALEPISPENGKLLCWKSVFAGVLISIMSYMLLTSLGAGVSGLIAVSLIRHDESGNGLATGASLWLGISVLISLFLGSYYALRVSKFITNRVGAAHGFAVASIFFLLMVGYVSRTMGNLSVGIFEQSSQKAGEMAAEALADAGWSLFVIFTLGLVAAVLGGRLGAHANQDRPIHEYKTH